MTKEQALVPVSEYKVMQVSMPKLTKTIKDNLGADKLSSFDFDRIKVPSGGGTTWEIPTLTGLDESKSIDGVIVFWKTTRGYWNSPYTGEGVPPNCSSEDGITGRGDPGGDCLSCPFNQFGTGRDDKGEITKGKACKEVRAVFLLRKEGVLPILITAPPMSLKPMRKYFLRLASHGVSYYEAVTRLALEKDKNSNGLTYSRIVPTLGEQLSPEQAASIEAYANTIKPYLEMARVDDVTDYGNSEYYPGGADADGEAGYDVVDG